MSDVQMRTSLKGETIYLVRFALGFGVRACEVVRGPSKRGTIAVCVPGGATIYAEDGWWCRTEAEARDAVAVAVRAARAELAEKFARDSARLDEIDAGLERGELPVWEP